MAQEEKTVLSEDPNAGHAAPVLDLTAAGIIAAIAIWFAIESLRLPTPGGLLTAPGLLPFLASGSLLIMAALLAAAALRRKRALPAVSISSELPAEFWRSMLLGAILVAYVAGLQFLPVDTAIQVGSLRLVIGNFEVATVIIVTTILFVFWQRVLWKCLAVAAVWVTFLSLVFRLIFEQRLP
jgi:hypothetical protein